MLRIGCVVIGWLVLLLGNTFAAEHRGALRGHVTSNGTALSGARLAVQSESTGEARRTTTDAHGRFTVPELEPGTYRITIEGDQYQKFAARSEVRSNETTLLALEATLPSVSAAIDFRPYFQYVDRASPWFRTRFDAPLITALPLDGRSPADLVALTPGVTTTGYGPIAVGSQLSSTAYLVDGVALFDPLFGTPVLPILPESVIELSVLTPPLGPRLGRSAGAQVSVVTRSGTNDLRGSAFTFYQGAAERLQAGGALGGPIRRDRTFVFGDFGYTRQEPDADIDAFTQASGRLDQMLGRGRVTARYAFGQGGPLERQGNMLGLSAVHQISDRLTNDARFGFARLQFGDRWSGVLPEFDALEAATVLTWSAASHVVRGGVEYFAFAPEPALTLEDERTVSAFVQDQWRASAQLTLTGGLRFDRLSRASEPEADAADDTDSLLSPRAGLAWSLGPDGRHVIRGDYGRHLQIDGAALDAWTVGLQRQWGRIRTLEVGYQGTRTDDEWTGFGADARYHGLRIQMQQRSETAVSAQLAYSYGRWTIASAGAERVRASLDSRHKFTAAFVWQLPFGDEARWFTDGVLASIFGDLQVAGIAATHSGRPRINRLAPEGPPWRNMDVAISKTVRFDGSALEVRAEVFNLNDRDNPRPGLLGTGFEDLFAETERGRRWQFGGRLKF